MSIEEVLDRIRAAAEDDVDELDLSRLDLDDLPPEIGALTNLTTLHLDSNQLTELPPEIGALTNLTNLDLHYNQLTELPPEIGALTNLTNLDLSVNQLTELPPEIGALTNLTNLNLNYNQLTELPPEIGALTNLTDLNLNYNHLTELPPEIGALTNLDYLHLKGNHLTELPPEIGALTNLTYLDLDSTQLTELPPEIGALTNLTGLDLDSTQLTELPPEIGALTNLTGLNLNYNQLTELPPEIGALTNLTGLHLNSNQLTELPPEIGALTNLTNLDLSVNQLTELPPEIGALTNLTNLHLNSNHLTELPPEIGALTNLTGLNLNSNQLTELPPEIGALTNLTGLDLDGNQLTELPPEIGALTNLTYLYLNSNHLTELPPEIGALTNLTYLYLNSNHLTELPPEIGALTNLGYLGLNDNQLTELPPEIGALTNLTNLGLNSNQVPEELLAAAAAGIDVLARYLDELSVEGQGVPLWEAKVLLVGEGEVGKSSLLGALRGDPWDPDRDSTHGLEITPLRLTHPEQHDVTLELNAWDFGGQDVYRPTHQLFFTAPAVYLVVWKPRLGQSQSQVDDWLRMITLRAPTGSRCLIVATHGGPGDHLANIAKDALTERYGDLITGFFEVDCEPNADGESDPRIADVRASIANAAASLPEMGHPYPEAWTKFRCRITPGHPDADQAVSSAPYVRYSELEQLADGAGIDSGAARALCAIASRRGQWIHYGDPENPPMPDDLVVTQPEWLAKAISFVMNDGVTRDAAGLLREDDLGRIWANPSNNAQYEPELYPVFVSLMESYDLAYEIEQSLDERAAGLPNRWLVAQLVPESPNPDRLRTATEGSDRARSVEWIVGFSDLDGEDVPVPYGLLYRLIVRFHGYSLGASDNAKAVHWQLGVVLRHDTYGVATVQVDDHIGGIRIKAMGTRPELLAGEVAADIQRSIVPQFWRGMTSSLAAACGSGCPNDTPGKGVFEIEHLLKAQDDNELTIRCHARRCGERVQIESLLSGYKPPAGIGDSGVILGALADLGHKVDSVSRRSDEHANAVLRAVERVPRGVASELAPYFSEHLAELRGGLNVLDGRMAELAAQANEHLDLFLADTDDPAQHGPRLITARAHDPHLLKRGWLTTEITFTLWCEYSRQPLYFIHGDPDNGRYRVPVTRATIKRVLPLLSLATKVVAGFSPVALMAGETHLEKATFEAIQSDVATAVSSLDVLSDAASLAADLSDSESESGGSLVNVDGGPLSGPTLRAVQDLIRNEDPNFAGLEMRRDKQRRRLWVDPSNFHRFPEGGAYG